MYLDPSRFDCEVNLLQNKVYETFNFFLRSPPPWMKYVWRNFRLQLAPQRSKLQLFLFAFIVRLCGSSRGHFARFCNSVVSFVGKIEDSKLTIKSENTLAKRTKISFSSLYFYTINPKSDRSYVVAPSDIDSFWRQDDGCRIFWTRSLLTIPTWRLFTITSFTVLSLTKKY